jgi:hypothetical protein
LREYLFVAGALKRTLAWCAAQIRCFIRSLTFKEHDMMMLTTNAKPTMGFTPAIPAPLFDAWAGAAGVYRDAMQASAQQWVLSSANIIQEHTLRAIINASQSCADALAKNAMTMQQKSMERMMDANQKVAGMMGQALTDMWMGNKRTR